MSKRIARILAEPEHLVTRTIQKLEDKNGYPSHDARLVAHNIQAVRHKIAELGLDPDDTTGAELYHALLVRFENDSNLFDVYCGAKTLSFDQKLAKAAEVITKNFDLPRQWVLKASAAREVLRQQPPKRLMKYLGYRSVQSLLKREKIAEILITAQYLESTSWLKSFKRLVSRLDQTDFELSEVELIALDYDKWADVDGPDWYVASSEEAGALAIWPSADLSDAPLMSLVILLAESLAGYKEINTPRSLAKIYAALAWWEDMDCLVADLANEHVSLNITDNALNHLHDLSFEERLLEHVRPAFWQRLIGMYENRPDVDGLFDSSLRQKMPSLRPTIPEPVYEYEYTEDI